MNKKENVTLYKGFNRHEDGTLWCRDFCFGKEDEIIGKTFTIGNDKPLKMCENGFHACDCIGKTLSFYDYSANTTFYEVRVKKAYFKDAEKFVFRSFKVLSKYDFSNDNTGNRNTGNRNTGNWNTGNRNTGNRNTGGCNTGNWNTGDWNTGDWNTGSWNTGDWNTGSWNTGNWNLCDYSNGFYCTEEPKAKCFNKETQYTVSEFRKKYYDIINSEPTFENLMKLPNATKKTVEEYLHRYNELNNKEHE
jgi:hypothetical protein